MRPIHVMPQSTAGAVRAVLADIDDTLTTEGRLPACAYSALETLDNAGIPVGVVTGRPAGWCDMIARFWPVKGVVGENGGLCFAYDRAARQMGRMYASDWANRTRDADRLREISERILAEVPGARVSSDQEYRETDLAIDFCEDGEALSEADADRIRAIFVECGAQAKISSIHVNGWIGAHDKLTMTRRFARDILKMDLDTEREHILFCGDSPNDAPMFAFFPNACGVANVARFKGRLQAEPAWIARRRGGQGFAEIAHRILACRQH